MSSHPLLFIGSAAADVVMRLPSLPLPGEDLHVASQTVTLGGCALNAFRAARLLTSRPLLPFFPVGTGVWGDFVHSALVAQDIQTLIPRPDAPNGCCYCLVTPDGERTFLCDHGAEYRFRPEWFDALPDDVAAAYLCGLEVEEDTGDVILDYLESHPPRQLFFAPGPRLCHIPPRKMARVMALHPVFHLSEQEACRFTHTLSAEDAAPMIHRLTGAPVIITKGAEGAYLFSADFTGTLPACPVPAADSIGAGDAHIGAVSALTAEGHSLQEVVGLANRVSAAVVAYQGAEVTPETLLNFWPDAPLASK